MKTVNAIALTGIVVLAAAAVRGQAPAPANTSMSADPRGADPATFVKKAALGGMTEVALSKAAASRSQDVAIRKFADQMIQDHEKANDELSSLAKSKGLQVPVSLDAEHQAILQRVNGKSASEFDNAYSKQMVTDHTKTVALFEAETTSADADLADFAKKTLPTLQEHKRMAGKLAGANHGPADADPVSKM
jgi:putative membrane protein